MQLLRVLYQEVAATLLGLHSVRLYIGRCGYVIFENAIASAAPSISRIPAAGMTDTEQFDTTACKVPSFVADGVEAVGYQIHNNVALSCSQRPRRQQVRLVSCHSPALYLCDKHAHDQRLRVACPAHTHDRLFFGVVSSIMLMPCSASPAAAHMFRQPAIFFASTP